MKALASPVWLFENAGPRGIRLRDATEEEHNAEIIEQLGVPASEEFAAYVSPLAIARPCRGSPWRWALRVGCLWQILKPLAESHPRGFPTCA